MMLERLQYKNHMGETIDFGKSGIFVKASDLHNYSWTISQKNGKISSFKRDVTKRKLPVVIFCSTIEEGVSARNRLMEVAERDILAKKYGKIIIGDYYYKCFISESKKSEYLKSRRRMNAELTLVTDEPVWVREEMHSFRKSAAARSGLTYPHDFPFDFASGFMRSTLLNTDFTASNFRMILYGACSNPVVYVSGHAYAVKCDVAEGEYLTIDSVNKTITKTSAGGAITNVFNLRGRDSYIFEKIKSGNNTVIWDGDFGIDIILMEERSEPIWT